MRIAKVEVFLEDVVANLSVPPMANSDGWIRPARVRSGDPERDLPVSQRIAAGQVGPRARSGNGCKDIHRRANASGCRCSGDARNCILRGEAIGVAKRVSPQENVRPVGADIEAGSTVFARGHRLRPQDVGVLASLGLTEVRVFP